MANINTKVTLYWLNESRAQRILWLLEELQVPYELKCFKRQRNMFAPPELRNVHPLGKSPVITVERPGQANPLVLAESGAIIEYLLQHFGGAEKGLVPPQYVEGGETLGEETATWIRHRYYMHYAEGSLMPQLLVWLIMNNIKNARVPFFIRPIIRMITDRIDQLYLNPTFETHLSSLEEQIKTSPGGPDRGGLCGESFTAADIIMSYPIIAAADRGLFSKDKYPQLHAYAGRLKAAEGYQKAVAKVEAEGKSKASL